MYSEIQNWEEECVHCKSVLFFSIYYWVSSFENGWMQRSNQRLNHISRALNFRSAFISFLQEGCLPLSLLSFVVYQILLPWRFVNTLSSEDSLTLTSCGTTQIAILICIMSFSTLQGKISFRTNTAATNDPNFLGIWPLWQFVNVCCLCQLPDHRKVLIPNHLLQNTFQSILTHCFDYFRQLEI